MEILEYPCWFFFHTETQKRDISYTFFHLFLPKTVAKLFIAAPKFICGEGEETRVDL